MKNKIINIIAILALASVFAGCANTSDGSSTAGDTQIEESVDETANEAQADSSIEEASDENEVADESTQKGLELEDGSYMVKFDTDSTMFHVNEAMEGRALLTVKSGEGNLHLIMPSKNVLNLYSGLAADAENNKEQWIEPSVEEVTYDDGMTEEVYAYDVAVYVMDEEFDLAIIGKKNVWYDHKVSISDPQPVQNEEKEAAEAGNTASLTGVNTVELSLEGGTGKAKLTSPAKIELTEGGYLVTIEWSSKHYDYMIVDGVKYTPVDVGETSIYEIPVKDISVPLEVIADTVAMSTPHEIEYTITFDADTLK